jgi:peptidoglycan hydrolase CwlO-like protein
MNKIKNNKIIKFNLVFLLMVISALVLFNFALRTNVYAENCNELTGDSKDECIALEKKAQAYQDIIDIKVKQQNSLQEQMKLLDMEQTRNQIALQDAHQEFQNISDQINSLKKRIRYEETQIDQQKTILSGLMQSYYEDYQQGVLGIVLANKDFSEILNHSDYIQQSSFRVSDVLRSINDIKDDLDGQKTDLESKKAEHEKLKIELEEKKSDLQTSEHKKQSLLSQTQGEEQKYQKLLERVEQQKLELFDFSTASNSDELISSVVNYPKPSNKYWESDWYYSQRDSRWANDNIGNSKTLMGGYGCAVTSLAMVFKSYGASIDPGKMANQSIFYYDLIKWPSSWEPNIELISSIGHNGVNWTTVKSEISKGNRVIVYIRKTNGKGGHYVVIHNYDSDKKDYVVNDPYFGANLYLETSKSLVGKIGSDSGTTLDQMIIYKK